MDAVGEDLIGRLVPAVASIASLAECSDAMCDDLRAVLEPVVGESNAAPPPSDLTGGRYPVELGVTVERGRAVGLKYTVDLACARSSSGGLDALWHALAPVLARFAGPTGQDALRRCLTTVMQRAPDAIYWSVGYRAGAQPRAKVYVVGGGNALDGSVLRRLTPHVVHADAIDAVLRAAAAIGKSSVDIVGFALEREAVTRSKCYLMTNPYIDLRSLNTLVTALDLPIGRALSLLRWYRRFIGPHWGQIGSFALGVDLSSGSRARDIEAYAYPVMDTSALLERVDEQARSGAGRGDRAGLSRLWRVASGVSSTTEPAALHLTGCSVDTGSLGRLGPMTVYLAVSAQPALQAALDSARSASTVRIGR